MIPSWTRMRPIDQSTCGFAPSLTLRPEAVPSRACALVVNAGRSVSDYEASKPMPPSRRGSRPRFGRTVLAFGQLQLDAAVAGIGFVTRPEFKRLEFAEASRDEALRRNALGR